MAAPVLDIMDGSLYIIQWTKKSLIYAEINK
jgi:hypothetical protein